MEINKVQWRMIAKGEKLPCDSFLMKYDGTIPPLISGAGVVIGQNAYYLPVEELRSFPKEESEDERMIQYFKDLAPFDKAEELYEKYGFSHNDAIDWLEKQAEQKPDDKVEPKFKVGDWVVNTVGDTNQVVKVLDDGYTLDDNTFISNSWATEHYHRWTIQDAKDGDVLCSGQIIVIFKHFEDPSYRQSIVAYIGLDAIGNVQITDDTWTLGIDKVKPATKEQRDTLLKAMADAGYTFDFDKKELKKIEQKPTEEYNITGIGSKHAQGKLGEMIKRKLEMEKQGEQKPAWSEEDEKFFKTALWHISYSISNGKSTDIHCDTTDWFKNLKDRLQSKQEWSEADDIMIRSITLDLMLLKDRDGSVRGRAAYQREIDWFKSLKDRYTWKPSDEQMNALDDVISSRDIKYDILSELWKDLKKL